MVKNNLKLGKWPILLSSGGGNCSVSDTINALGGGQVNFETLTINVDNCGGVTSYPCKTVTINVDKRGGVPSNLGKTLTIIVDKCDGGISWGWLKYSYPQFSTFWKNSTLWKLFFNSLKNFSHLFEKKFSTLWKMFKGEKLFKGEKIFKGEKYDRWKISKAKTFQRQEKFPISILKSRLENTIIRSIS